SFLFALPLLLVTNKLNAQTTLAVGDIAIIQNQADTPDDFAFITFVDIDAGTGIYFTDCGTDTVGFRTPVCTEGAVKYTVPAGGLSAGDIIKYAGGGNTDFTSYTDSRITGGMGLATSGDQVIAFQDATNAAGGTNAANTPTFLFVIHNASTLFTGNPNDSNETSLPPGLSDSGLPRTALGVGAGTGVDNEWDNTVYMGSYDFSGEANLPASIAAAKIALTDPANYAKSNGIADTDYSNAVSNMPDALQLFTLSTTEFDINKISMYPNPANNFVTISNADKIDEVIVFDVTGKEVIRTKIVNNQVNISQLNSGMYLINLKGENIHVIKKLIKQ
ncbi:MAG: T9SS type A sorting domain-containing protein, partial [Oceanihabitans sp.]